MTVTGPRFVGRALNHAGMEREVGTRTELAIAVGLSWGMLVLHMLARNCGIAFNFRASSLQSLRTGLHMGAVRPD